MKTMKTGGRLTAIAAMLSLSALAQAEECAAIADDIEDMAFYHICNWGDEAYTVIDKKPDGTIRTGEWGWDAIWQWKGKGELGCKIHYSIASQLYVPHGSPPKNKGSSKNNGYRQAQGAAAALRDNKLESALLHLQNVIDTIDNSAKLNPDFRETTVPGIPAPVGADYFAGELRQFAVAAKARVLDPVTGEFCSVP